MRLLLRMRQEVYELDFENGAILTPFASSFARTVRAMTTALGSSPCTQIVSISTGIRLPETVVIALS